MQARVESAGVIPQCVCMPYVYLYPHFHDLLVVCRKEWQSDTLSLYKWTEVDRLSITFCVTMMSLFKRMIVDRQNGGILSNIPSFINSGMYIIICVYVCVCYQFLYTHKMCVLYVSLFCLVSILKLILESVTTNNVCIGNSEDRFVNLPTISKSNKWFKGHEVYILINMYFTEFLSLAAVVDSKRNERKSLYHVTCEVLVPPTRESSRCTFCSSHRNTLRAILSRTTKDDRTNPSSHTNYTALSTPEKVKCLHRLHLEAKNTRQKLDRLKNRIGLATAKVNVDKALDSDLQLTISEHDENVKEMYPEGSFQRGFLEGLPQKSTINEVAPSLHKMVPIPPPHFREGL